MFVSLLFLLLLGGATCQAAARPQAEFDPQQKRWTLANGSVEAAFRLSPEGRFVFDGLTDFRSGESWQPASGKPAAPFRFRAGGTWFGYETPVQLVTQSARAVEPGGVRLTIVLEDLAKSGRLEVGLELYADQPVLRYDVRFTNLLPDTVYVNWVNMVPWSFADAGRSYTAFRVNQWVTDTRSDDFSTLQNALDPGGKPVEVYSGAHGQHCGWLALRDDADRGLFAGWEFDGRARTTVRHYGPGGYLQFASVMPDVNHPVPPGGAFEVPAVFLGLFHGDWDEAGWRTQRFAEAVLAKTPPDPNRFPFVGWDSWGYGASVTEEALRHNAEIAAKLGVELFTVDLGWARQIGDWRPNPAQFPSGLRALSDYVHLLGMKFGLHFAFAEAAPDSPVLTENPDWTSSEQYNYFGAQSLCLSHQPVRKWIVEEAVRMIDEYNPDWILQDGENMVKQCTKATHTHDPADSNYSNSVEGLNAVVGELQRLRPNVYWENCEDGGNMMTFNMVHNYVTSITNDASGSLSSRKAVYGATYPFPPRYTDRYMPEQQLDEYTTNSYMFGGPWLMMNRLAEMTPDQLEYLAGEIAAFKVRRTRIADGKVFHLAAPGDNRIDAIQSYDPGTDSAVAVVSRTNAPQKTYVLRPRGLRPETRYIVSFENETRALTMTGAQLMRDGVRVQLPVPLSSDIVYIDPR